MFTVIQDIWNTDDDQELIEYVKNNNIPLKTLSKSQILDEPIGNINVLFCDTDIIRQKLTNYETPSTYPNCFRSFYHRRICIKTVEQCLNAELPIFVKPIFDKLFDGFVIDTKWDIAHLTENAANHDKVYCCEAIIHSR